MDTSDKKQDWLWKFITCQELLRRHSSTSAPSTAIVPASRETNLDTATFELSAEGLAKQQKAIWTQLQELYLQDARIVFCTASTAGRKALRGFRPSYLIVEEASQMVETQALNAIMRNYSSLRKVVLSGDMAQLPPTVLSAKYSECSNLEEVSFFKRMIKTGHPHTQLVMQYRMAPEISKHVSDAFYGSTDQRHYDSRRK